MPSQKSWLLPSMTGRTITLTSNTTTQWQLIIAVKESPVEMDRADVFEQGAHPNTRIDFLCENLADPSHQAFIAMFLQIPVLGTESLPPSVRALQATKNDSERAKSLRLAYYRLHAANCQHTPAFLGIGEEEQGPEGWVPGGYVVFLGFTRVPGERLGTGCVGEGLFYELPFYERERIREAFRRAYT
ncbi:uncharacterized protein BO80DRAFT_443436 [Aspergillus ibericus CBS 121593]|uniref:Uncharacterized protein n=1 Tax=Aspergillus ibericus CBS 121593 TaxID=1448316 RepID=A0A395H4F8_9EURO|nr:hypothetical protein BO80DRAFT_443436 [Aspergillus ibericus CBS 121593]RAL02636.1 hypothetical protein BO80DRAFT_443436 [Aspergillus ibericus CBS 121593]